MTGACGERALSPAMYGPSVRPVRPALSLAAAFGGGLDWQASAVTIVTVARFTPNGAAPVRIRR